ncbi:TPA: transporter substrate-binding domain-containing protein [Legionella pneumophila]|nr:transporter substrate-binding domain-containing protein [Legionella pneumophila]HAU1577550.1 transporter substrate-binding domain-containing protein [Legionella pneumophila]HAU1681188.1 transporter substrate-binding domain-containing protein [Legionella pneumophila]HAU3701248.1 transporter substrate-binding domain-containing protein [Legionella pneumophila]
MKIPMKFIQGLLLSFFFLVSPLHAQNEPVPLIIGVGGFYPPFIMQGTNNELFGYDIATMTELCKIMKRQCNFRVMRFKQLIPALIDKQIDAAISAISITSERSNLVNFSMPYLLSYSRFLTNEVHNTHQPFNLMLLKGKRIGVEENTVFSQEIRRMGIIDPVIVEFDRTEEMLEALSANKIDFVLMDNPAALYWSANSSGRLMAIGSPMLIGYGLGIAVNRENSELLKSLNSALVEYQRSDKYKENYNKYMMNF